MSASRPAWMTTEWLKCTTQMETSSQQGDRVLASLATEILRQDAEIATMTNHIGRLKDDAEQFNVRLADMARQRDVLHGSVEDLRAERAKLTERIRLVEDENIESGKEMAAAVEDRVQTDAKMREVKATNEMLRTEIATLTAEVAKLKEHSDHDAGEILRLGAEAANYQKLAKEAADAEGGTLVLIVDHDGTTVRIFGPDRGAEERFGETVARWWKLVQVTGQCLDAEDKTKKAEAELAAVMQLAVEKWLDDDESDDGTANPATRAARAREVALKAIEKAEAERDAAIRDRNEFAASEVERFARNFWDKESNLFSMGFLEAVAIRAAELRKAAGAAAPVDLPRRECKAVDVAAHAESIGTIKELNRMVNGVITHATPPADRQREDVRPSWMTDEWLQRIASTDASAMRSLAQAVLLLDDRLAASEKAKAELLAAAKGACVINDPFAEGGLAAELRLRQAIEAAERAVGAS